MGPPNEALDPPTEQGFWMRPWMLRLGLLCRAHNCLLQQWATLGIARVSLVKVKMMSTVATEAGELLQPAWIKALAWELLSRMLKTVDTEVMKLQAPLKTMVLLKTVVLLLI